MELTEFINFRMEVHDIKTEKVERNGNSDFVITVAVRQCGLS